MVIANRHYRSGNPLGIADPDTGARNVDSADMPVDSTPPSETDLAPVTHRNRLDAEGQPVHSQHPEARRTQWMR